MERTKRRVIDYPNVDATLMLKSENGYLYGSADNRAIRDLASTFEVDSLIFEKQRKKGFFVPRSYKYYMYNKNTNVVFFPKGAIQRLEKKHFYSLHSKLDKPIAAEFTGKLHDRQEDLVNEAVQQDATLIQAPTGSGKSYIIQGLISKIKQKTIVISPSVEIARGLYDKFTGEGGLTGCTVGMVGGMKKDEGDVLIMVAASFALKWKEYSGEYPLLIIDEAHEQFTSDKRIEQLCLYQHDYIYGLTATPEREEVHTETFDIVFGRKIIADKKVMKPQIIVCKYITPKMYAIDQKDRIEQIFTDEQRTLEQAQKVKSIMDCNRNMGLVLVSQKDVAEELTAAINAQGVYAESYTGDTKISDRKEVLARIHKNKGVMVATYQVVGTGFDYPQLDTCFYYCPVEFIGKVKQAVGRILRECKTTDYPLLVDWIDKELQFQGYERLKLYKEFFGVNPIEFSLFIQMQYLRDDRLFSDKEDSKQESSKVKGVNDGFEFEELDFPGQIKSDN